MPKSADSESLTEQRDRYTVTVRDFQWDGLVTYTSPDVVAVEIGQESVRIEFDEDRCDTSSLEYDRADLITLEVRG